MDYKGIDRVVDLERTWWKLFQKCVVHTKLVLSCTDFIWAGKLYWLDRFLLYAVTDQNIAFLVPDSCWAIERNGSSISANVTDDAFENVQNDTCFSYFQTIWQLFWTFWYCRINTIYAHCRFLNIKLICTRCETV
jgi:hypothetical protein